MVPAQQPGTEFGQKARCLSGLTKPKGARYKPRSLFWVRLSSKVVMHGTANPVSAVRFRPRPPNPFNLNALFPFRSAALLEPVALSRYLPMARGEDAAGIMIYQRDRPALEIPIA